MLAVRNNTPFSTALMPALDKDGQNYAVVVIKGTFDIHQLASTLVVAEEQFPIQNEDAFYGDPETSSVRYEADLAWVKNGADVVLNGHAYAPAGRRVQALDASLQVGAHKHTVRVYGDRYWEKSGLQWRYSSPEWFERMPLSYENAYGGSISVDSEHSTAPYCVYNPIGKGYTGLKGEALKQGLALPNLEAPGNLIQFWEDPPPPTGFGFIGRSWQPRVSYAGTYDLQWEEERMPLLPMDFDNRYHNGAHPSLVLSQGILGGEEIVATNLSESGTLTFALPAYRFRVSASLKGRTADFIPVMDTVLIEPDDNRVILTWRLAIPCAKQFLYIDNVTVDWSPR